MKSRRIFANGIDAYVIEIKGCGFLIRDTAKSVVNRNCVRRDIQFILNEAISNSIIT